MKSIQVIVDKDGKTKVEAIGCVGSECQSFTRAVLDKLGQATEEIQKSEFFLAPSMENQVYQS